MNAPAVTVLMPARNAGATLREALESVCAQTFRDFELLVIDDASEDRTPEILAAWRDPRLRVLRNDERRKLAGALNRGLDEAQGELVARMDADDRMRPDRLARQVSFLARHPDIACCGGWARTFGDGARKTLEYPADPEAIRAFALFYTPFAHPTVMFRRERFAREGLRYDGSFYPTEDYELWSRTVFRFPCANLPRVLLDYRVHARSMTGGEWSDMDAQTVRVQAGILARLGIEPSDEESRLHRAASLGQLPAVAASFARVEGWLSRLEEANRERCLVESDALLDVLNDVWFRTAMSAVREMGGAAWDAYRASRLAGVGRRARLHRWTVHGAALKAAWVGRRS
jgi:glycosyltransferase involved in cell wall biosynthesis